MLLFTGVAFFMDFIGILQIAILVLYGRSSQQDLDLPCKTSIAIWMMPMMDLLESRIIFTHFEHTGFFILCFKPTLTHMILMW